MKSHSGMVYTVGGGTFLVKSTKQLVVSKSSTRAEVIAASDGCDELLSLMEFINFLTDREGKARLYQDNTNATTPNVYRLDLTNFGVSIERFGFQCPAYENE
jgi:hypothetical protein